MQEVQAEVVSHYRSQLVEYMRSNGNRLHIPGQLTIRLAKQFGFCYGVERAIDLAYAARKVFALPKRIFLLGEIIHNPEVNEQIEAMGHDAFAAMLRAHKTAKGTLRMGCITRYDLGPFGLQKEMAFAKKFGTKLMVCGGRGRRDLTGPELKAEVKNFAELMKPHLEAAEAAGLTIAIENHNRQVPRNMNGACWGDVYA